MSDAGQKAKFTKGLILYNSTDDEAEKQRGLRWMAEVIRDAPRRNYTRTQVTQGASFPSDAVDRWIADNSVEPSQSVPAEVDDEKEIEIVKSKVEISPAIRRCGIGQGTVYGYGFSAAPDALKIGSAQGDATSRIAEQIYTSTPGRPVLFLEIKCEKHADLERAIHHVLRARGKRIEGGGTEWFNTTVDEVQSIYEFVIQKPSGPGGG